jgi:hypothetical protein
VLGSLNAVNIIKNSPKKLTKKHLIKHYTIKTLATNCEPKLGYLAAG